MRRSQLRTALVLPAVALLVGLSSPQGCGEDEGSQLLPMHVDGTVVVEYPQRDESGNPLGTARAAGFSGVDVSIADQFGELGTAPVIDGGWQFNGDGRFDGELAPAGLYRITVDLPRHNATWSEFLEIRGPTPSR